MIHAHKKPAVNGTGEVNQALAVARPVRQEPGSTRWDPTLNIDQRAGLSEVFAAGTGPGAGANGIQRGLKGDVGTQRVPRGYPEHPSEDSVGVPPPWGCFCCLQEEEEEEGCRAAPGDGWEAGGRLQGAAPCCSSI